MNWSEKEKLEVTVVTMVDFYYICTSYDGSRMGQDELERNLKTSKVIRRNRGVLLLLNDDQTIETSFNPGVRFPFL